MRNEPQSLTNPHRSLLRKDGSKGNEVREVWSIRRGIEKTKNMWAELK